MKNIKFGKSSRMLFILISLLCLVWIVSAEADDVYNFYFQKGAAPQTVVQGGNGQAASSKTPQIHSNTLNPEVNTESSSVTAVAESPKVDPQKMESEKKFDPNKDYKTFIISGGYGHLSDSMGTGSAYMLGFQINFNRYLGVRTQGRYRVAHADDFIENGDSNHNLWGGMAALVFTPFRLTLLDHRFVEISALAGAESFRKLKSMSFGVNDISRPIVERGIGFFVGASALLGLNENVGLELIATKSPSTTVIGANIAFQF